jgi:hypothetical protein
MGSTACGSIQREHVGGVGLDASLEHIEVDVLNRFEASPRAN